MPICVTQFCHCADFNYITKHICDIRFKKLVTYIKQAENKRNACFNQVMVCVTKNLIELFGFQCKCFLIS